MTVAFIDTETLGLDPDLNPVWEVAVIRDGVEHVKQLPVTAVDIERAHPVALEITAFASRYREPFGNGASWDLAITRANRLAHIADVTAGCHLVGAVPSFDEERLRREMRSFGIVPSWHYHLIDIEALAAGYLAGCRGTATGEPDHRPPWDSKALSRAVGVDPDEFAAHTALGDARWTKAVYEAVMGA